MISPISLTISKARIRSNLTQSVTKQAAKNTSQTRFISIVLLTSPEAVPVRGPCTGVFVCPQYCTVVDDMIFQNSRNASHPVMDKKLDEIRYLLTNIGH